MTAVQHSVASRGARSAANPFEVFASGWRHRHLVSRLTRRDVLARYRGSLLGLLWSFLNPLLMLAAFTFVFNTVLLVRWGAPQETGVDFALILFAGLIVFWFLSDCLGRAPTLILENVSYVKTVLFPLETLPWVVVLSALFHTAVSSGVFALFHLAVSGPPPWTALLFPLVIAPVWLFALGAIWFLASLGVYLRDVRQIVPVAITLLLFLSAIFYPVSAIPEALRPYMYLNPLVRLIEEARAVLIWGRLPDWPSLVGASAAGWLVAWLGLAWFTRTRKGFADVI